MLFVFVLLPAYMSLQPEEEQHTVKQTWEFPKSSMETLTVVMCYYNVIRNKNRWPKVTQC